MYGAAGDWAQLFAASDGYLGTELFTSLSLAGRYLTVDRFSNEDAWQRFQAEHHAAYQRLDARCAKLTQGEREIAVTDKD